MSEHTTTNEQGPKPLAHVASIPSLLGVFAALLVLTGLTYGVATVDLGSLNLLVAMGVAVVKATLVVLFFMHLRHDKPFNAVVFVVALLFVTLFIVFTLMDVTHYQPDIIQGPAPGMLGR